MDVLQSAAQAAAPVAKLPTHPKYRPDIDGLRALAVACVIVFHAFPDALKGGFIGVDVFFVISGFLISTIIYQNQDRGSFSFLDFYLRRSRRIFPALVLVLLSCFVVGWVTLPADAFKPLAKHIAGSAGFMANYVLLDESGYFDTAAEIKPLLHLWSLGIEEQFYIGWPLLLWVAWKWRFNRLALALIVAAVSVSLNARLLLQAQPNVAKMYYSAGTRIWELLIGSILAYLHLYLHRPSGTMGARLEHFLGMPGMRVIHNMQPAVRANLLAATGTVLLATGLAFISRDLPYPGWWGFLPTVGTALLITAGPLAWINRQVLSHRVAVWLGRISFPLYLWHWPLLVFARIFEGGTPPAWVRVAAVLLAVVLAWATRRYVEDPIRQRTGAGGLQTPAVIGLLLAVGCAGYTVFAQEGLPARYGKVALKQETGRLRCLDEGRNSGCTFGNPNAEKMILVWGDSHAEQLTLALGEAFGAQYRIVSVTNGSCFMGDKMRFPQVGNKNDCDAAHAEMQRLGGKKIFAVVRSQRWHVYPGYDAAFIEAAVRDTLSGFGINAEKYIIVGSTADTDIHCQVANYYSMPLRGQHACNTFEASKAANRLFIAVTGAMTVPPNTHFIYPYATICPDDACRTIEGSVANYADIHHLSKSGAMRLMPQIRKALEE